MNNKFISTPRVGDKVEFSSDLQTEKGPSSGSVIHVEDGYVTIRHSDHPGESFKWQDLIVNYYTINEGKKTWVLQ